MRPGSYKYGDVTEVKTAEELKDATERHPIISLTYRHPSDVYPRANEEIGTVKQTWNAEKQWVDGEFWFHDDKIPEELRKRLENNEPVPVSAGILLDSIDVDGTQHGMVYTHVAVLDEEANPVCPLGTCGINVRMESNPDRFVRHEQTIDLEVPEEKVEVSPEPEVPTVPDVEEVEPETKIPKTEEPAEDNPEEDVEEPEEEEEVTLVPEVKIPVGETVPKQWERTPDGWITFTLSKQGEK